MSVSMIYTGVITGSLLALGLKFAGTHHHDVKNMIIEELHKMFRLKIA